MLRAESAKGNVFVDGFSQPNSILNRFYNKIQQGMSIEELLLQNAQHQRRAARLLCNAQRQHRRRCLQEAVSTMKAAASDRLWSAVAGTFVKIGVALGGVFAAGPLERAYGGLTAKLALYVPEALAEGFSRFNPWDKSALEKDCQAKQHEEGARQKGERIQDIGKWLATVNELEQRMLVQIEQQVRTKHQMQLGVLRQIGS